MSASGASADTVFDFAAPGADQEGDYVAADGAVVAGGAASLAWRTGPDWAAPGARWRVTVRIASDLPRSSYPVRIDLAAAPDELFLGARGDGLDLRLFDAAAAELPVWLERYDWISGTGALWARPAALSGGTNTFHCYFGEPDHDRPDDVGGMFAHDPPVDVLWVIDEQTPAGELAVAALDDGTRVAAGSVDVTLAAGGVVRIPIAGVPFGGSFAVGGPVGAAGVAEGADAPVPLALAAATLLVPSPRYMDRLCIASPFRAAAVDVRSGTASLATMSLGAGETRCTDVDIPDGGGASLVADAPILAFHNGISAPNVYDGFVAQAPFRELFGGCAGTCLVVALEDGTNVDVWLSDGTSTRVTLAAGAGAILPGNGAQGSGAALHLSADRPVAAISYGDGDGGESVPFLPPALLGERFVVPLDAQYAMAAAERPGTECELLAPDGTRADFQRGGTLAAPHPSRLFFGTATSGTSPILAGSQLRCDGPVWAVFEDGATGDEKTLWPVQVYRPVASPEPAASFGAVESRHAAGTGTVTTPTWRPRWGLLGWMGFAESGATSVPAGTSLRYQISVDGGATWLVPEVGGWRAAASGEAAEPWDIDAAFADLPLDADGLTVRALLGSGDGAEAPVLDELVVRADVVGEPAQVAIGPISSPQQAGRAFAVLLTLLDAGGLPVTGYTGTAALETTVGPAGSFASEPFAAGRAVAMVAIGEAALEVRLRATAAGAEGLSDPFQVVPGDVAALELVSGDGQFGLAGEVLAQPLRVRAVDAAGNPVSALGVVFEVSRGGGEASPANAYTDANGAAATSWIVGEGPNVLDARLEGRDDVAAVRFTARGDTDAPPPAEGEEGGCGCRAGGRPAALGLLVGILAVGLGLARGRRRR
ncbi:MAG: hypothetical protein HY907_02960 [Deltaproteobacteria bacterium]|nr:hypothetical protein [Deltaproteobacteria bacterium]